MIDTLGLEDVMSTSGGRDELTPASLMSGAAACGEVISLEEVTSLESLVDKFDI